MTKKITKIDNSNNELTVKQKLFIEYYIKHLGHITDTCKDIGIERKTYYLWINNNREFKEAINNIPIGNMIDDLVRSKFIERIKEGSDRLISEYINRRGVEMGLWNKQEEQDTEPITIIIQSTEPTE